MILLIKLILAHLLGDFVFQSRSWVEAKESKRLKAWQLYVHALVHGGLVFLILYSFDSNSEAWKIAVWITAIHFIIDLAKVSFLASDKPKFWFFRKDRNGNPPEPDKITRWCFVIDQIAHFLTIYILWICFEHRDLPSEIFTNERWILLAACVVFLTQPIAILMQVLFSRWTTQMVDVEQESLENAGKYIGILERLFVFAFVITDHWQAIGFLMAAKSIFRFGYLQESKNRRLTEYVLIGTLMSFGIALLTGIIYLELIKK
ncbi:MAG: DUF3307 domain-containing protein [Pyrinomonadaceae bacterium]